MLDPRLRALPLAVWELLALAAICLFFALAALLWLCARDRRRGAAAACLLLLPASYALMQCFLGLENAPSSRGAVHRFFHECFLRLPPMALIALIAGLSLVTALLWRRALRYRRSHLTPMSVKEAVDSLPVGICCFRPWGRTVLVNTAMETLCRAAAGRTPVNGGDLRRTLAEGTLLPGCRRTSFGGETRLLLPDGAAWSLGEQRFDWEGAPLTALLAADVTEAYRKTLALEKKNRELNVLNQQLAARNREIVDLTIQAEILAARVRLHDALGENLLTMKQLLRNGGSEQELETLRGRLRRSVSFLREDAEGRPADELTVLLETAKRLGVTVEIAGEVPRDPALAHVVTVGLHECLTNLLRHARGDALRLALHTGADRLTAVFSGNGRPPEGEIRETGGLRILRACAERAGGSMRVETAPDFRVILELPKEREYAV